MTYRLRWLWWVVGLTILLVLIAAATHTHAAELYPFGCSWSLDYEHYRTPPHSYRIDGAGGVYSTGVIGPMWIYDCCAGGWHLETVTTDTWWNPCLHTVWVDDVTGDVATVSEPTGIIAVGALLLLVLPWVVSARSHPP
jgi:hypothetical protein